MQSGFRISLCLTRMPSLHPQTQFLATYESEEGGWRGGLQPYGPLSLLPSSQALNYGQSIFEGMKVIKHAFDEPMALSACCPARRRSPTGCSLLKACR